MLILHSITVNIQHNPFTLILKSPFPKFTRSVEVRLFPSREMYWKWTAVNNSTDDSKSAVFVVLIFHTYLLRFSICSCSVYNIHIKDIFRVYWVAKSFWEIFQKTIIYLKVCILSKNKWFQMWTRWEITYISHKQKNNKHGQFNAFLVLLI